MKLLLDQGLPRSAASILREKKIETAHVGELESLALESLNSGAALEVGPGYWEEKHRRLDERLKHPTAK